MVNLKKNLRALKKFLPENTQILPVIKNDAYGHGLVEVAKTLSQENIWGWGLSEPEEAQILRKKGFKESIILLSGFEKDWIEDLIRLKIIPVVTSFNSLEWLKDFVIKKNIKLDFHLKIDTGMHRFGIPCEEIEVFIKKYKNISNLKLTGVMTHFSCSEKPDHILTQIQLKNFKKAVDKLIKQNIIPKYIHFANSGGIIFLSEKGNLVRPGISLFGGYPHRKAKEIVKLYPVMTLKSRIVEIRKIKKGEYAGYGPNFKAERNSVLGLVPVGYGDGYLRSLSNKGFAVYRGKRVKIAGTISMKCLYVDLTDVENPQIGDEIILLGGENEEVPVDELAELAGTISYELFCNIGKTIPKEYLNV